MVPFKTKLKPVLMNKKHVLKTSLSYFIALRYILRNAADFKKPEKLFFFCLCIFIKSNSAKGLILKNISNPIRIFKKIKHFDLQSAILCRKNPNSMMFLFYLLKQAARIIGPPKQSK
jgi:hypothetical protein